MSEARPTVNELVEVLKRSQLPTVVTEGAEDYLAYRRIEERLSTLGVSFLPAGGREAVLQLFERRAEFGGVRVAFVVDRDLWVFGGVPPLYSASGLIFTDGYSIENDLFRDGDLKKYLLQKEVRLFERELRAVTSWYSYAAHSILSGANERIDISAYELLTTSGNLHPYFVDKVKLAPPPEDFVAEIRQDVGRLLRGKSISDLLIRQLSASKRKAKYSRHTLIDIASAQRGNRLCYIEEEIRSFMSA